MKPIERKKEQKREAIVRAAQECFRVDGYIGTSMDSIAQKAGVTKQTVYRYFESKELLFRASLEAQREGSRSSFLEELDREDSREALTRFAIGFLRIHMSEGHLAGIRLLVSEGPSVPEMTRAYYAVGPEKTQGRLAEFLRERFQVEDAEYPIKILVNTLLSMRMAVLIGLRSSPSEQELIIHAEKTVDYVMKMLS